jgi:hypothetical protein
MSGLRPASNQPVCTLRSPPNCGIQFDGNPVEPNWREIAANSNGKAPRSFRLFEKVGCQF